MTALDQEIEEAKFHELTQSLKPIFHEDSALVARALTMAVRYRFTDVHGNIFPGKEDEYRAALERLPSDAGPVLRPGFVMRAAGGSRLKKRRVTG